MKKLLRLAILAVLLLQTVSVGWAWQIERPHREIAIEDRVESAYTNGEASVGLGVATNLYIENHPEYLGYDVVMMNMSMTANSRVGISYDYTIEDLWWIPEELLDPNTLNLGDNDGTWVDMPYGIFRFYGGQYSAEYQKVWVCSNGFIAFDEKEYTSPTPQDIPYSGAPNAIIAAVWTDLQPDASTKIFTGIYREPFGDYNYFVITWKNIKHKLSGQRLTFQIILGNAWNYRSLVQSFISISYMKVKAINTQFTWGIEDHQGCKGLGDLCDGANLQNFNSKTITFSQNSKSFYLKRLTITFQDSCSQTRFNILEPQESLWAHLCGYHILGGNEEPTPATAFAKALGGTAVLLIGGYGGFILETTLIGLELVADLAESQYGNRQVDVYDYADSQTNWAEAYASTWTCVDASLSIFVHWILLDTNDQYHSLTITAKAEYHDLTNPDNPVDRPPITTTVNLEIKPDDNDSFDKADLIEEGTYPWLYVDYDFDPVDYYKIWVPQWHEIVLMMTLPSYSDFNLYLYDPSRVLKGSSELGTGWTEYVDIIADSTGYWYIKVTPVSAYGFYSLTVVIGDLPKPPPETPSKPSGFTSGYVGATYSYSTRTTDPNGDSVCYEFDWGDGSTNTTGLYPSGVNASASHSWSSPGTYNITVRAQDVWGLWSDWSQPLTVNIEPTLVTLLNTLGFTNIEESTVETFIPGIYRVTLYAEFAGYHAVNELSWYTVGTTQYNLIFSGPEGNHGYVDPPIVKSITINSSQFGLSFLSQEERYFTETSKNPDGIKHAMIYKSLDEPYTYLIGFEDKLGGGDKDYNDMVISLDHAGWVSPTGYEDPYNAWSYEPKAYDDDTITFAYSLIGPGFDLWTSPLILTVDEIQCNKVRYWYGSGATFDLIRIEVFKDGDWEQIYEGGGGYGEVEFTEGTVTKARIRIHFFFALSQCAAIFYEFDFWEANYYVNLPPSTPSAPSGPTTVYRNVAYTYTTSTTDPDGDDVYYQFEFTGPDTTQSFTTGPYASGETGKIIVQWLPSDPLGTYQIRVRAQDVHQQWSGWSPPLTVTLINQTITIITINCSASWYFDSYLSTKVVAASPYVGATVFLVSRFRAALTFPLDDLPSGAQVTQVRVKIPCSAVGGSSGLWDIHPYGGNGQYYPCSDSYSSGYPKCAQGTEYVDDLTRFRSVGTYWFDLGSQACTDVQNAKSAVNRFSLGLHEEGDNDLYAQIRGSYASDPVQLEITYTLS